MQFQVKGKGHTLPTYWAACARCENLIAAGDDDGLLALMAVEDADAAPSLATFRIADLGGEPLAEGAPDQVRP